jgi:hypothetical protein
VGWSSSRQEALRAAWDQHAAKLLLVANKAHDIGAISSAYNRMDDVAWLSANDLIDSKRDDYTRHILDMQLGLYVAGRWAGYSDEELRARGVATTKVKEVLAALRGSGKAAREGPADSNEQGEQRDDG